jgi:hypothetical protein
MGTLRSFNITYYIEKYNTKTFIETGTYMGDGLSYANEFNFEKLYSIEMLENFYDYCNNKFNVYPKIKLINNNSVDGISEILPLIKNDRCLYWLDAHLPDYYDKSFGKDYDNNKKIFIPLEEEIFLLKSNKDISKDVFILDDLRIYEKGNFQSGNWDYYSGNLKPYGCSFIYDLLDETHNIQKDYRHEGYIICTPKN